MRFPLSSILPRVVRQGRLLVYWPDGGTSGYGNGVGPTAAMRLRDVRTVRRLALNPALAFGEAYMDDALVPVGCTIRDLLEVLVANLATGGSHPALRLKAGLRRAVRRLSQYNSVSRSQRNVAHHYDLSGKLYSLFLDRDLQYSCAYFLSGSETLEEAQALKKRHIATKLLLDRPGLHVLDIGCGWGGLALTLARDHGARVTAITLSTEQLAEARARAEAEGLSDRVTFELRDYRTLDQAFDRVVSVGMFEHVGVGHYGTFFATLRRCLAPDGVALLHAIGNSGAPSATNPWLARYIFPGGYSPSLSEVFPHLERSGLVATDVEILRLHYAQTLAHWQRRFAANRDLIASMYDQRFCRMFEFYLAGCEMAFRYQGEMVFQIQLTQKTTTAPITRNYMLEPQQAGSLSTAEPAV